MNLKVHARIAMAELLMAAIFLFSSPVQAGGHKVIVPPPKIDIDPAVEADVKAVIHDTAERWNSQDFATILWERLRGYLDPARPNPAIEVIREEMSNIHVKLIAPDLAIAVWDLHFEMKIIAAHPIGENVRVSAVLRRTDAGWRYIHWAESPKTAMVYIEDLFERDVAPGWDEYYENAQQRKKEVWRRKRAETNN